MSAFSGYAMHARNNATTISAHVWKIQHDELGKIEQMCAWADARCTAVHVV